MPQYAQTNLQLYNQMRAAGYGEASQARVREAYDLATRLFTAKFRGSGKPLLSHLVGTSSVLCGLGATDTLLAAGVLHAAYVFGDFGDGRPGMTAARREIVRRAAGGEVEDLVARYHLLDWRRSSIERLAASGTALPAEERDVLLIRLANELEDHLDLGVLYCRNAVQRREEIERSLHLCAALAARIGEPCLAAALTGAFEEARASVIPEALRHSWDYTYLQMPASGMRRPVAWVKALLDRHPHVARLLHPARLWVARHGVPGNGRPAEVPQA